MHPYQSSFANAIAITPDDDTDVSPEIYGFIAGTGGAIQVATKGGQTVDIFVIAGMFYPLRVARFKEGGDAADIVGFY